MAAVLALVVLAPSPTLAEPVASAADAVDLDPDLDGASASADSGADVLGAEQSAEEGVEEGAKNDAEDGAEAGSAGSVAERYPRPPPPVGARFAEPLEDAKLRISYSFERTSSRGLNVGDDDRTPRQVRDRSFIAYIPGFTSYQQTPTSLDVTRHEFQLAYAPHPRVTLVAELPFIEKELARIDACAAGCDRSEEQTDGIGDITFAVLVPFIRKDHPGSPLHEESHVFVAFDAPTGSIRRSKDGARLPYDNQIGNGTWDFEWGWTYRGSIERFSWGGQITGRHPLNKNDLQYREGSRFEASFWSAARLWKGLSASLRVAGVKQNNTSGRDRGLNAEVDGPSSNAKKRGGYLLEAGPGLALDIPQLANQRLSVEVAIPIYQWTDGAQSERDWSFKAGWQWVF